MAAKTTFPFSWVGDGRHMQDIMRLKIADLRRALQTQLIGVGERLVYVPEVASTSTLAMELARERPAEGLVVLADSQTAGKGRQGRRWVDMPGCHVLSSTLLYPLFPPHLLVMIASLAVVEAIEQTCAVQAAIKWPNDVLIGERKVSGILIETSHDSRGRLLAVLGIGINVNGQLQGRIEHKGVDVELASVATTLESACGHPVSREKLLSHLLATLEDEYVALQREARTDASSLAPFAGSAARRLRERWQSHLTTLGRTIKVHQGDTVVEGVAEAINDSGELLLRLPSGTLICITWGVVEHSAS